MLDFRQLLETYGVDYPATMKRFMGNTGMYQRLLGMLFQDDNFQKLGSALECGELRSAFEAAHTLKGIAGNMGLTPLYEAVSAMVEPLRTGESREDYPALYEAVRGELQKAEELWERLEGGTPA